MNEMVLMGIKKYKGWIVSLLCGPMGLIIYKPCPWPIQENLRKNKPMRIPSHEYGI